MFYTQTIRVSASCNDNEMEPVFSDLLVHREVTGKEGAVNENGNEENHSCG